MKQVASGGGESDRKVVVGDGGKDLKVVVMNGKGEKKGNKAEGEQWQKVGQRVGDVVDLSLWRLRLTTPGDRGASMCAISAQVYISYFNSVVTLILN